jgi:flagellar hook-associated protein 2
MSNSVSSLGSSQITSQIDTVETRLDAPIKQLQTQETTDKAEISAWGAIQGTVSSLSTALAGISDVSTINNRTASTSTPGVVSATAANTASLGQYDLTSVTLAKAQEIYSPVLGAASAALGAGSGSQSLTFSLKSGKTETVSVGSGDLTLNGIAAAINKLGGGVTASVLGTADGARLVLQGSATGSSQAFSVSGTGALAQFDYSASAAGTVTLAQKAANASLSINGVPVTETSNTVNTAIPGVSLSLAASGSTTLTIGSSPGGIAGAVGAVATSLNAAIAEIAKETLYKPATTTSSGSASSAQSGPLLGNFTASDLSNQLLTAVTGAAASGFSANAIGLSVSSTGAVSFNSATFATAYAQNPSGVIELVNQIYKSLHGATANALGSSGSNGSINAQTQGYQASVTSITSQITAMNTANNAQLKILVDEYSLAEAAATSAETTQAYLSIFTSTGSGSSKG